MIKDNDESYKVIIAGSTGVGKSSLLIRFTDNNFSQNLLSTIGVDFKFKTLDIKGQKVKMQIWDTAGSQNFKSIVSAYYRGAHAVILVFSLADRTTFDEMTSFWIRQVRNNRESECEIMIFGNKCDTDAQVINEQQLKGFMKKEGITIYKQCSAKTGNQVKEGFSILAQKLMLTQKLTPKVKEKLPSKPLKMSFTDSMEPQQKKKKCCG